MKWRFEKQMAHQCSMKYKDLTLYAILLYHQQVSNAQSDLIEKCLHNIVLLCLIWRNLYQIRSINCFHLKKTAVESYRLLGEAYGEHAPSQKTWTIVSVFQNWRFRCCRQGTRKTAQKVRRRGIVSIAGWRWFTNTKTTRRAIER